MTTLIGFGVLAILMGASHPGGNCHGICGHCRYRADVELVAALQMIGTYRRWHVLTND